MDIPIYDEEQFFQQVRGKRDCKYYCMYSSWFGGIVMDPSLMLVPVDDHIVHRGDGVFEAMRYSFGAVYDLESHLDRLDRSRQSIGIDLPIKRESIREAILKMISLAHVDAAIVRLYLSRGPGGFTTNPYESEGPQLYIVLTEFKQPKEEYYLKGATAKVSEVALKTDPWHQIKSCNYLPNVMMKKEAVDSGVDYTVSAENGFIAEGSTENIAAVINGKLMAPPFDKTLKGTTLNRVLELAESKKQDLGLNDVSLEKISIENLKQASEIFFVGTTIEVLPVTLFEGEKVGDGQVGVVAKKLKELLVNDMKTNESVRTS